MPNGPFPLCEKRFLFKFNPTFAKYRVCKAYVVDRISSQKTFQIYIWNGWLLTLSLTIELLMLLLLRLEMFQMLLITMIMRMGMITIFIGALLTVTILEKYFKYSYHGHLSLNKGHKCQTEYIFPSLAANQRKIKD